MNIKLVIEYDGTNFYGFEIQTGKRTVRGEIESAIFRLTGEKIKICSASRTDKGVHALAQVVNFNTSSVLSLEKIRKAMNAILPDEIYIKDAVRVEDSFHARYSARGKIYLYRVLIGRSPLRRDYVWEYRFLFDMDSLMEGASLFCGRYDFRMFARRDEGICNIRRFDISKQEDEIHFEVEGDRFLHKQVRIMIGTLFLLARCKIDKETIIKMFDGGKGMIALAPASGLYLKEVIY